jgi:hypothetical protein
MQRFKTEKSRMHGCRFFQTKWEGIKKLPVPKNRELLLCGYQLAGRITSP